MSQNEILWTFCNSETSFQSEEMSFEKAIDFAKKIPLKERESWFAWQTGWEDWKAVLDVDQFKDHVRNVSKPPPLPPRRHTPEIAEPVVAAAPVLTPAPAPAPVAKLDHQVLEAMMPPPAPPVVSTPAPSSKANAFPKDANSSRGAERRRHPRHEIRFRVIIRTEELTFRTFTKDISLGGCSLENPIPERLMEQKCQIFIGDIESNENIRFTLQPTERRDRRYFSFSGVESTMQGKLGQWIETQVAKAGRKRAG